jgi:hypothetical protein
MVARVLAVASLALVAGCQKDSELYCGKHPEDITNCGYSDAGIDARPTCMMEQDCSGGAPHCELSSGMCVACLDDTHCPDPTAKYCDTSTYTCKGCVDHIECASEACLPSGECGTDTTVAYVDPLATATTGCTKDNPCKLIDDAVATGRPYVKLTGQILEPVVLSGANVTFLADADTTLSRANAGVVITVSGGSTVAIHDLTVIGLNESGITIANSTVRLLRTTFTGSNAKDKPAIEAKMASTLTMSRSLVYGNKGGGIYADATTTYNITNTIIVRNGADDSAYGGAVLDATNPGERRFEMNTVVDNRSKVATDLAGGVTCPAGGLAIPNNLILRNYAGNNAGALTANELALTHCNSSDSMVGADIAPYMFVMPEGAGPWDYHVSAGSMAIDRGVASDIGVDYDGHIRPQGAKVDVGADEYRQP